MPYQAELATVGTQEGLKATAAEAADPERFFTSNLCANHYHGCPGGPRPARRGSRSLTLVEPVLGPVQSVPAQSRYAAQALAKAGHVVLTFDPRGSVQGRGALVRLLGDACASALGPTVHETAPLPVSPGSLCEAAAARWKGPYRGPVSGRASTVRPIAEGRLSAACAITRRRRPRA